MTGAPRVLLVPGWTGSSPGHWQSLWNRERPEYLRVEQRDWDVPVPAEWDSALDDAIRSAGGPLVLAAHSMGCVLVARWAARRGPGAVIGALLVAPCDVEKPGVAPVLQPFAPIPLARLPFPAHMFAGTDDTFVTPERARTLAGAWGATLELLEGAGHICTATGHGPWPEGLATFDALVHEWSGAER